MSITVNITGDKATADWLAGAEKKLAKVPQRFSEREDLKNNLRIRARISMDEVVIGVDTRVSRDNMNAESNSSKDGIVVYQAFNSDTEAKWPKDGAATDPYILFFMAEYARYSFLPGKPVKDFFALWPALLVPVAEQALQEEVDKALRE